MAIDIDEILKHIIPNRGMITAIITTPEQRSKRILGFPNDKAPFILVPYPLDSGAIAVLRKVTGIGYDWRAVPLKLGRLPYDGTVIFYGDSYHSYEPIADIISQSCHIHEISLPDEDLDILLNTPFRGVSRDKKEIDHETVKEQSDPNFKRNSYVDMKTAYTRTRALWKAHNGAFNDWERKFVQDIGKRLGAHQSLSEKQRQVLGRMFGKYKVSQTETAADDSVL
jgi:hypothetical protein